MKIVSWLLAIVCITFVGCATGPTKPPSADVTGTWAGEWYGNVGSGFVKMNLQQSGASVTGDIAMSGGAGTGAASSVTGPVTGDVSGDEVSIRYQGGIAHMTVRENEMSGTSSIYRWTLKRQ